MPIIKLIRRISSKSSSLLASVISIFWPQTLSKAAIRSPRKIAIFTEGQTEQIFIEQFVLKVADQQRIHIDSYRAMGGRKFPRFLYKLSENRDPAGHEYYVLIVDCGSDGRVASEIRDQYPTLTAAGYSAIIAVRDVAPDFGRGDIPRLIAGFNKNFANDPVKPLLVTATMEVEAWFIGEHTHFERIDSTLTPLRIQLHFGLDILTADIESRPHPAEDLHDIYQLVGLSYSKSKADVDRTVNALDFSSVRQHLPLRVPSFRPLSEAIVTFLSP